MHAEEFWPYLFHEASWDYRYVIRVVAGRVLKRLLCDLLEMVNTGMLIASRHVHYDVVDHKVKTNYVNNFNPLIRVALCLVIMFSFTFLSVHSCN